MKSRVAVIVLALSVLGLAPSADATPATCGGAWSGIGVSDGCAVPFNGFPITVNALARGGLGGAAAIFAVIEIEIDGQVIQLAACGNADTSQASCSQTVSLPVATVPLVTKARCRVGGYDHGTFTCSSGS